MQQSGADFTLIDVRERDEYEKGSIPGAVGMPRGVLEVNIDQITTDKDRNIVLYCGVRQPLGTGGSEPEENGISVKKLSQWAAGFEVALNPQTVGGPRLLTLQHIRTRQE